MKVSSLNLIRHLYNGRRIPKRRKDEAAEIAAVTALDSEALAGLFDQYAPDLYQYLHRSGLDTQQADQAIGDVFARFINNVSTGESPRTNLRMSLFQIAYQLLADQARDLQRVARSKGIEPAEKGSEPIQLRSDETLLLKTLSSAVEQELTEEQRSVIILRYQEEFSLQETAEIVGKRLNEVKALQESGIETLRKAMSRENRVNKNGE